MAHVVALDLGNFATTVNAYAPGNNIIEILEPISDPNVSGLCSPN